MKKKGLIVATIVMVLVLAVSLTTATYAWFSSQASATVDDLTITTKAADGLQIAMRNKGAANAEQEFQSGNLTYDENGPSGVFWTGDVSGWGSELGFDGIAIGEMTDAVTYWNTSKGDYDVFSGYTVATSLVSGRTYYTSKKHESVDSDEKFEAISGTKYVQTGDAYTTVGKWDNTETTYYTIAGSQKATEDKNNNPENLWERKTTKQTPSADNTTILATGQFLVPTGYDEAINPIGYTNAVKNDNYYYLTMAVKPVTGIGQLGFKMQFTPTQNRVPTTGNKLTEGNGLDGAMAAATRVNIKLETEGKDAQTLSFAPYSAYYVNSSGNALNKYAAAGEGGHSVAVDGAWDDNGLYQILLSTTPVEAGTIFYVTIEIWIEGTDKECRQETAGGGVNLAMEFLYQKQDDPNNPFATWTEGDADTTIVWSNVQQG